MQTFNNTQIASNLNNTFRRELDKAENSRNNVKGTHLYEMQVEFMYAIDSITRGSSHESEAGISSAKKIIGDLKKLAA